MILTLGLHRILGVEHCYRTKWYWKEGNVNVKHKINEEK